MDSALGNLRSFKSLHEIELSLRADLTNARAQRSDANARFWSKYADVFISNHGQEVEFARETQTFSRRYLLWALKRLDGFLAHGTIPSDIKLDPASPETFETLGA